MKTTYTAYDKKAPIYSDDHEGYKLDCRSDKRARILGRKIATEKNFIELGITFFRESDNCRGELEI